MEKGKVAGKAPIMVDCEEGKVYAWCSCGMSENQPFCNGAHKGTEHAPLVMKAEETKAMAFCTCKQTSNPPFCDGSHSGL